MATNAERQRAYRQRHLVDGTASRLNMIVEPHAKAALTRLARHYGVTERAMLERIIGERESDLVDGLKAAEQKSYYDGVTA